MPQIVICSDFFDSFGKLPAKAQSKVRDFFEKFTANSNAHGLNYEKINKVDDKQLFSARLDDAYRIIIYEDVMAKKLYMLWIDHHDEAYAWARQKTQLDLYSVNVTLMSKQEYMQKGLHSAMGTNLFSRFSAKQLAALGVKLSDMQIVRSIPDMKTFETYKDYFPNDVYANLEWVASGMHVKDMISYNRTQREQILDYIKERVLFPALHCADLEQDIKDSVQDTYERLELKETTKEILDFFEDALISRRGGKIHDAFMKHKLDGFEEIADDVRKMGGM